MEEWKEYRLGDVCSRLRSGKSIPSAEITSKGMFSVIGGNGFRGYTNMSNFKGDCVVIGRQGANCGNVHYYSGEYYMTEHAIVVVGNRLSDTYFLGCVMSLMQLGNLSSQSAQPGLSVKTLSEQIVRLPSVDYQKKISTILKSLDEKIRINRKINSNLEEQAKALFKSWFIDFEPFKSGKFVESELGMIPEGWNMMSFESFISESQDKAMVGTYPAYSVTNNGITPRTEKFKKQLSKVTSKEKVLRKDDLVFGMSRQILNWGIMQDEIGSVSSAYHVYKIDKGKTDPTYLRYFIKGYESYFRDLIGTAAREGQSLDKGALMNKKLLVPSKDILRSFIQHVTTIENTLSLFKSQCRLLSTLRDTLLPRLLSGEIDVK